MPKKSKFEYFQERKETKLLTTLWTIAAIIFTSMTAIIGMGFFICFLAISAMVILIANEMKKMERIELANQIMKFGIPTLAALALAAAIAGDVCKLIENPASLFGK